MTILDSLMQQPGVFAAGQYSYHHDGSVVDFAGKLDPDQVRMASLMCRNTTHAAFLQSKVLVSADGQGGFNPARGWLVFGKEYVVCAYGNYFCFIRRADGDATIAKVMTTLQERLPADAVPERYLS